MRAADLTFDVAPDVLALGVRGAYFTLSDVRNRETDPAFDELRDEALAATLSDLSPEKIKDDPILRGFRGLHEAVGRSNRKNVASPENLLNMLLRQGRLPRVNLLVDVYNLISIKFRLALGAHDLARVTGNIQLRMTAGGENFWPLGAVEPKPVEAGEYAYVDDGNDIICRLEVRQVEKTKVTLDTRECFYIVQGNALTDDSHLKAATEELLTLTKRFCGGEERMLHAVWDIHSPSQAPSHGDPATQ
jgi:DNA/RNA-binding domain of Phe-tRNA-synthetase-like protein